MSWRRIFIVFTCAPIFLHADWRRKTPPPSPEELTPWFTGPLIVPNSEAISFGHFESQTIPSFGAINGFYDSHWQTHSVSALYTLNIAEFFRFGIGREIDFFFSPSLSWNFSRGKSAIEFTDLPLGFEYQLYSAEKPGWFPGVKIALQETLPAGKYQRLNPKKQGTDLTGLGTYQTDFDVVFYKIYPISGIHAVTFTGSLSYAISTSVRVHGFNAYGGGFHTNGKVHPGNNLTAIASFEYSLTQNWVLALDNVYM